MALLAAWACMQVATQANAQDIEPRACSNAPMGVDFLISGHAYTRGGVSADLTVPLSNADCEPPAGRRYFLSLAMPSMLITCFS
ncbi:MAG: hypothetical protein OEX21_11150 [Betaproteobacteria bacterium]|nr:hypothetical protein [Betaproteobacteria bacterium]